jgi:hypothetical protein
MRKYLGAGLIVVGIVLTGYGLNASDSLNSRVSRLFTGMPADGATWLLVGGILSVFTGLTLAAYRRPRVS